MNPTLRRGSSGTAVRELQQRLAVHGFATTVDGKFGPKTEARVREFQKARKLVIDGIVGVQTWAALLTLTRTETLASNKAYAKKVLAIMGWRVNTEIRLDRAIKDYQEMYNLSGAPLVVDGIPGPKTTAALQISERRRKERRGDISANFNAFEFRCKCGDRSVGPYSSCRRIWASRALVRGAEAYRTLNGPFSPISACRCKQHNAAVGGYSRSQHLYGQAMDVSPRFKVEDVIRLRAFSAISVNRKTGTVRHLDNRHLGPDNYPKASGSTSDPYVFQYG